MDQQQLLQYVSNLNGVGGCFMADSLGQVLSSMMPEIFDDAMLAAVAINASHLLETFKSDLPDCQDVQLDMELMSLYVREMSGDLLVIIIQDGAQLPSIRIAANVASKRYSPSANHIASVASVATSQVRMMTTQPVQTQVDKVKSNSLFGFRKKEPKPKSDDGGIWG